MNTIFRIFIVLLFAAGTAHAQGEFIVNSASASAQREPRLATDGAGNAAAVWRSGNDIHLQRFDAAGVPAGQVIVVNSPASIERKYPSLAMNDSGDLVVAWTAHTGGDSLYDVIARVFRHDAPGSQEFIVNTYWQGAQTHPSIAMDSSGSFLVAWESWFQDGSDRGVYAQRFDANGGKSGAEFRVNATTAYSQARPAAATLADGKYVIVWESWEQDQPAQAGYGVFGRLWNSDGSAASDEFPVNSTTDNYQWYADVKPLKDGGFVAAWCSWEQDGSDGGIFAQLFNAAGQKQGGEFQVNSSTAYYQWLPRISSLPDGGFAIAWSSWKQDGDREGVYAQLFDADGRRTSFETRLNEYVTSFQWEPDIASVSPRMLFGAWSSWGQTGHDYDIVARRMEFVRPEGWIDPASYAHASGRSTTRLVVHVVDSLALTGNSYDALLDSLGNGRAQISIRNRATGDTLVTRYPLDRGKDVFYLTPTFEGVAVEVKPETELALNTTGSYFANHSGSTLTFTVGVPTAGTKLLAPLDAALIWGSTDTLADGSYAAPLDTAINTSLKKVPVPFTAWNLTDNQRMDLLVVTTSGSTKWRPGQRVIFLTPAPYRITTSNTHAELLSSVPAGPVVMPAPGDTNFILTRRPIRPGETYTFTTNRSSILDVAEKEGRASTFDLLQNYPNPFNPTTTIRYSIPADGNVVMRVYNILGQRVATLVEGEQKRGSHRISFDGAMLASGVYFYRIEFGRSTITQKMLLIR